MNVAVEELISFFRWEHLPEKLQPISRPFAQLADEMLVTVPENRELTVCLRKLLEAKDCAVRAAILGENS